MGPKFKYAPMFQLGEDTTQYYKIPGSEKLVKTIKLADGKTILEVSPRSAHAGGSAEFPRLPVHAPQGA